MRAAAGWLLAWIVFSATLALGALAVSFALFALPAVFLAGRLLGRPRAARRDYRRRGAVYEGEFRVLDETVDERP